MGRGNKVGAVWRDQDPVRDSPRLNRLSPPGVCVPNAPGSFTP